MKKRFLSPFAAALALSGCGAFSGGGTSVCPAIGFMADAGAAPFFAHDVKTPAAADVSVYAILQNLRGDCVRAQGGTEVDFTFDVAAQKTALGQGVERQNLSYFIAIVDKDETVLQRQRFYVTVDFGKNESGISAAEHRVNIPSTRPGDALTDKIIVGFTLTPEQVAFNKAYPHDLGQQTPDQARRLPGETGHH